MIRQSSEPVPPVDEQVPVNEPVLISLSPVKEEPVDGPASLDPETEQYDSPLIQNIVRMNTMGHNAQTLATEFNFIFQTFIEYLPIQTNLQ